ncbi:TspO/MBR family protein [Methylobacterium marchantiae]|uniref:TspO/MBR family protein n=1 Tax=Methylobacterium marchantiae TaxID=600331 RepID=A0ABW3WVA8_9HYPH|nr:Tryptophan-rich protein TspO [Methylobacterium marchantiae]
MTTDLHAPRAPALSPWPRRILAIAPVAVTAVVGSLSTTPNIEGWYAGLAKPSFNPPNWLFPVAWTVLYTMIAASFWRLLGAMPTRGPSRGTWQLAVAAFVGQLVLNAAWTPTFFAAHLIGWGLIVVIAMFVMILWTIRLTWRFDRPAAWLLVPYAVWVAFATLLNAAIWQLN